MAELVYNHRGVQLYRGDALQEPYLWTLSPTSLFLLTDPPYGMNTNLRHRKTGNPKFTPVIGDEDTVVRDHMLQIWREQQGGPGLVFGTWRKPKPADTRNVITWCKGNSPGLGDLRVPWGSATEEIYLIGEVQPELFQGPRVVNHLTMDTINSQAKARPNHPTPKPVGLIMRLMEKISPHATIVDPFAGSGATLRAAQQLGRGAIGVEINPEYAAEAAKLLEEDAKNL